VDGRPEWNTPLQRVRCTRTWTDNMKTIKFILQEHNARMRNNMRWLHVGPMVEFSKHGNEPLTFRGLCSNIIWSKKHCTMALGMANEQHSTIRMFPTNVALHNDFISCI
jgi:hypothetical protein